jgi:hypothetical protein
VLRVLRAGAGILTGSDGGPTVFLSPVRSGDLAPGQTVVEQLLRLGTPLSSQVAPTSYADMLSFFDAKTVTGAITPCGPEQCRTTHQRSSVP